MRLTPNERLAISLAIKFSFKVAISLAIKLSFVVWKFGFVGWIWITAVTWCLPEGESFSPQPTARIAKAITSRPLVVAVKKVLEGLEFLIFVCDDAEVNCREILQSK